MDFMKLLGAGRMEEANRHPPREAVQTAEALSKMFSLVTGITPLRRILPVPRNDFLRVVGRFVEIATRSHGWLEVYSPSSGVTLKFGREPTRAAGVYFFSIDLWLSDHGNPLELTPLLNTMLKNCIGRDDAVMYFRV